MTTSSADLSRRHFRRSHLYWYLVVLVAAVLLALLQPAAWAQQNAPLDPPGRVARLNLSDGAVSFAPADDADWSAAELNRPLTSGDRLWTGPDARAELHIGSTAIRMDEQTSLDLLALDDNVAQLRLAQGTLQLRVRTLFEGQRLELDTPNLAFVISQPGDYRLDVNPASDTTRVVAQSGGGVIYGSSGEVVNLGSQQQASFTGTQLAPAAPGAARLDDFDQWAAERDRREDQSVSARYLPRETIGYQQLDSYGDWHQDPTYGAVWLPRAVPVNWAPYRVGHWRWIAPWGWTWIDDAPWGFAPFHYGRWAQIGPRWAWVPGRLAARPVYAPALVAFVGGNGGGVNWSLSIGSGGLAQPGIGWFPLAPGEAFRPAYRVSPRYVSRVNQNIVVNKTVKNVTNVYRYQRQPAAVTAVSRDDFANGRPVQGKRHPLSANDLSRARVVAERGALPQRPGRANERERPSPVPAAALPPAAVTTRPVVNSRDDRRNERRIENPQLLPQDKADKRGDKPRAGRPDPGERNARTRTPAPAAPAAATAPAPAPTVVTGAQPPVAKPALVTPPAVKPVPTPAPDRGALNAELRARREQQQLQIEQARQQRELIRQQDQQRRQGEASLGQRALREQAQKQQRPDPAAQPRQPQTPVPATAPSTAAPPAVKPVPSPAPDRNAINAEQRAHREQQQLLREQARQQRELIRQQQAPQPQPQPQTGARQEPQRQAREQAQKLRKEREQEAQKKRQPDAANAPTLRPDGEPRRNRQQQGPAQE